MTDFIQMPDNASLASSEHMITPEGSENVRASSDPLRESSSLTVRLRRIPFGRARTKS